MTYVSTCVFQCSSLSTWPNNFLVHNLNVFQRPADGSDFFSHDFHPLSYHRNRRTRKFDIAMSKFPKMFEDSVSPIRGFCGDCDKGGDENRNRRNQTNIFDFFGAIFVTHQEFCDDCDGTGECVGSWVTKIAPKKSN